MDWLEQNWLWVLFAVFFVGMHFFGHGSHGSHGGHGGHGGQKDKAQNDQIEQEAARVDQGVARTEKFSNHEH